MRSLSSHQNSEQSFVTAFNTTIVNEPLNKDTDHATACPLYSAEVDSMHSTFEIAGLSIEPHKTSKCYFQG